MKKIDVARTVLASALAVALTACGGGGGGGEVGGGAVGVVGRMPPPTSPATNAVNATANAAARHVLAPSTFFIRVVLPGTHQWQRPSPTPNNVLINTRHHT
ncbi:hypothetical protein P1A02_23395, partial [Xanthomonas hortorum pv. gardneri]|uniref:hypothetical protein n=1 Tax=Xanthomonas hortorum TaxID=56454 RepID=UPI0039835854